MTIDAIYERIRAADPLADVVFEGDDMQQLIDSIPDRQIMASGQLLREWLRGQRPTRIVARPSQWAHIFGRDWYVE